MSLLEKNGIGIKRQNFLKAEIRLKLSYWIYNCCLKISRFNKRNSCYTMLHWVRALVLFIIALVFSSISYGASGNTHTKLWGAAVIIGPVKENTKIKYYLEPQIRFIDNQYKFEEAFMFAGLGYQPKPDLMVFLGNAWVTSKSSTGNLRQENRIWQQAIWNPITNSSFNLISRTRLEERKNIADPQWLLRFRERLMVRVPFKKWERHAFVLFNEVFFNLNHPKWDGNTRFFTQNRVFLGIGTTVSQQVSFDIGYLNQYQFRIPNQIGHVLFLNFNFMF